MMQQQLLSLRRDGWNTNNVQNTDMFSVRTGNTIQSRQFTNTEGGNNTGHTLDTSVTISSIGSVQFVSVTSPSHTFDFIKLIQKRQVKVTWQTEDGVTVDLAQSFK
uniref:L3135 protein n=1 Tax=Saccharomyces cerevisiae TaxID=4932 RepID=E9PAA0_YEASX|nr:L3135 [Saccharomyces cerevisiae]